MGKLRGLSVGLGLGLLLSGCYPNVSEPWWNQPQSRRTQPQAQTQHALPPGMIEVAKGETVYALSRRFNVGVREIIDANNLQPPFKLLIGQRLRIPAAPTQAAQQSQQRPQAQRDVPMTVETRSLPNPAYPPPVAGGSASPDPTPAARPGPDLAAIVMPEPKPKAGKGFLWPLKGDVLEPFGSTGKGQNNDGINIAARRGDFVRSAENGVVVYAGSELKGFGNLLLVKHQNGWVSAYAHNELLLVGKGDSVQRGQAIARAGATGHVKAPQLHFELRHESKPVDPLTQLVEG